MFLSPSKILVSWSICWCSPCVKYSHVKPGLMLQHVETCWNQLVVNDRAFFFWSGQPGPNRRAERNRPNRNNLQTMLVVLLGFPVKPASQLRIVLAMSVSPITSCWRFCHDFSWSSRYHGAGDYPEGCEIGNRLKSVEETFANHQQLAAIP